MKRISSGVRKLDDILGGGFLPSSNVVIRGSTGVGKTVLTTTIAAKPKQGVKHQGLIFDYENPSVTIEYARKMHNWPIKMLKRTVVGNYYENFGSPIRKDIINGNHSGYYDLRHKILAGGDDEFISSNKKGKGCIIFDGLTTGFSLDDMLYLVGHVRNHEELKEICLIFSKTSPYRNIFEITNAEVSNDNPDTKADTIIALGYLPIDASNPVQKKVLSVIKHRKSQYDGKLYQYSIGRKGFEIGVSL